MKEYWSKKMLMNQKAKFDPVTFTENGTWVVPRGIKQIRVDCVAAQGKEGGPGGYPIVAVSVGHAHTAPAGSFGLGANGTVCGYEGNGGAGGAGWFGGGAGSGAWNKNGGFTSTGGGGSSYTDPELCSEVVHTQGFRQGNGYITISMVE